jgi:hypothetical protein
MEEFSAALFGHFLLRMRIGADTLFDKSEKLSRINELSKIEKTSNGKIFMAVRHSVRDVAPGRLTNLTRQWYFV